jgi:cation-transporting ATPase 13A3/4/5
VPHPYAEETIVITRVESLYTCPFKQLFFILMTLLTCGLLYAISRWSFHVRIWFRYRRTSPDKATHVLVYTDDDRQIVRTKWLHLSSEQILTFQHHFLPYYFLRDHFEPLYFDTKLPCCELVLRRSIDYGFRYDNEVKYGPCQIEVQLTSAWKLLVHEIVSPYQVFEFGACALWYYDSFFYYTTVILLLTLTSLASSLHLARRNQTKIHDMALFQCEVEIVRGEAVMPINSLELVPGDVIVVKAGLKLPCDAVLVNGCCVVDDSELSGESVPLLKDSLPVDRDLLFNIEKDIRHILFEGSTVLQIRRGEQHPQALVLRTGFQTLKGKLVRSILFPKSPKFKFYWDSMKFTGVMGAIALTGFCYILYYNWEAWTVPLLLDSLFNSLVVIIPPALPAVMAMHTALSLRRLKHQHIYCISPQRINAAGRVNLFCFDKTGTLTEEGMELHGVRPSFEGFFLNLQDRPSADLGLFIENMAVCHSLVQINGAMIGDSQELSIFEATRWRFEEATDASDPAIQAIVHPESQLSLDDIFAESGELLEITMPLEVGIVHIFHFSSKLMRMGVITRNLQDDCFRFHLRGAPEKVIGLCDPETVPDEVSQELLEYTLNGYRVMACATRLVPDLNYSEIRQLRIKDLESSMTFLGLIILKNKLKPESAEVLYKLHRARVKTVMVTGDHIHTATSVARECRIIDKDVYACDYEGELFWYKLSLHRSKASFYNADPLRLSLSDPPDLDSIDFKQFAVAITGDAFEYIYNQALSGPHLKLLSVCLDKARVYARMTPDQKTLLIECLQANNTYVGMVGDGANDCGALKAADVGISISDKEASIAAPFTSNINNVGCVLTLLCEGRCSLYTSIQAFKFMAIYSFCEFSATLLLQLIGTNLDETQYTAIDLLVALPLAVFMSYAEANPVLERRRPTDSLFSWFSLSSVFGHIMLASAVMGIACWLLSLHSIFETSDWAEWLAYCDTVVFLVLICQIVLVAMVMNTGAVFHKRTYSNWRFAMLAGTMLACCVYLIVEPADWIKDVLVVRTSQIIEVPSALKCGVLSILTLYAVVAWAYERLFVPLTDKLVMPKHS